MKRYSIFPSDENQEEKYRQMMVRLCKILRLNYLEVTEEEVIDHIRVLQLIREGLVYNPSRFRWESKK